MHVESDGLGANGPQRQRCASLTNEALCPAGSTPLSDRAERFVESELLRGAVNQGAPFPFVRYVPKTGGLSALDAERLVDPKSGHMHR